MVNLGYVVNVIEHEEERAQTLRRSWDLAQTVLVVSARLRFEERQLTAERCADGMVTGRGTFQKFFEQDELRSWISETLGVNTIAAEPGIFYVFRHPEEAERFLLTRVRVSRPRLRRSDVVFDQHQEVLNALIAFIEETGASLRGGVRVRGGPSA